MTAVAFLRLMAELSGLPPSAALEKAGVKRTLMTAGEYKGEMASFRPLSDEARQLTGDLSRHAEDADRRARCLPMQRHERQDQVRGSSFGPMRDLVAAIAWSN